MAIVRKVTATHCREGRSAKGITRLYVSTTVEGVFVCVCAVSSSVLSKFGYSLLKSILRFSNNLTSLTMAAACYIKSVEHLSPLSDKAWIARVLMILIKRDLGDLSADCFPVHV